MPEDETQHIRDEPGKSAPQSSQPAQKVMKLSDLIFWNGNRQIVHSLNVLPRDTTLITEGGKRTIVLPGRIRDAFRAPPYVLALVKAIEKNPADFGARNIAMICDALLSFVHNEGPGASTQYSAEFAESRGRLDYMFEFEYFLSTTAADIINSLGIELKAFRLTQDFKVGISEMKQFAADNELYGGFTGRISKEDASFYVPHGLELIVRNDVFHQGWYISLKAGSSHPCSEFYVLSNDNRLFSAYHYYIDSKHLPCGPVTELSNGYKDNIHLQSDGAYPLEAYFAVDSDAVRLKNEGHDPFLVSLRKGESFDMHQIKKMIDRR